jgi:flagellar hook-associated protein 1 FlgK
MAAAGFQSNIVDPRHFAAAAPVLAQVNPANLGTAQITPGTVLDANDPSLLDQVEIRFSDPPVSYDVVDVASGTPIAAGVAYVDGGDIDVNGYRVQISGSPQAGDRFDIRSNAGGAGDNRNFLALAGIRQEGYLNAGATGFGEEYSALVAEVGSKTSAARNDTVAQTAMLDQAVAARESVAGVNLDEEAANLLRFQQAYQANAEIIRVADEMFQSILAAVGN